jgi:hypothetical protein
MTTRHLGLSRVALLMLAFLPAVAACGGEASGGSEAKAGTPDAGGDASDAGDVPRITGKFSFFVTSIERMRELSGSEDGFGGNLGGLEGADAICQKIARLEGAGHKTWRAFLSATAGGPGGGPVHAIERIGEGPWYDRIERLVAPDKAGLLTERPAADPQIVDVLPNERGEPLGANDQDDHDILTGTNAEGGLFDPDPARTCADWTSTETTAEIPDVTLGPFQFSVRGPMCGHAWAAISGASWMASHPAPGCAAGGTLAQTGPPAQGSVAVGGGGGYGGIYCFALTP